MDFYVSSSTAIGASVYNVIRLIPSSSFFSKVDFAATVMIPAGDTATGAPTVVIIVHFLLTFFLPSTLVLYTIKSRGAISASSTTSVFSVF